MASGATNPGENVLFWTMNESGKGASVLCVGIANSRHCVAGLPPDWDDMVVTKAQQTS